MIARIIPTDTSFDTNGLSYFLPEAFSGIPVGALVEIPLREELGYGIFAGENPEFHGTEDLKAIAGVTGSVPLEAAVVETVSVFAKRHALHIHKALGLFFPRPVEKRVLKYGLVTVAAALPETRTDELRFVRERSGLEDELVRLRGRGPTAYVLPSERAVERLAQRFGNDPSVGILRGSDTDTARAKFFLEAAAGKYSTAI